MALYQWTISADNPEFNGVFWGIHFDVGHAEVRKKYYADLLVRKGCRIKNRVIIDPDWNPKKILVIRLGAYGDNLMITTALRGLRNKFPEAIIHFFGSEPHNQILINNPDINAIIKAPVQDIGHMVDEYDEVYDLIEHIEHNPESDWRNAYELAEERLEVREFVKDWEHRPVFIPTDQEIIEAKHILNSYGFGPDDNKLILIHAESSSIIRRISILTAIEISQHYIDKGYKILFAGHDQGTPNMEFQKCSWCKEMIAAEIFGPIGITITTTCPHCKREVNIQKTNKNKNIFFLHQLLSNVSARTIFTMQKFVDLVVAVDSAHSHIAAALDIPSVLIYGPIDPRLRRARSYNKNRILSKSISCGPCHQLSPYCVMNPKGPPPCMTQYVSEDIIVEMDRALVGDFNVDDHTTKLFTGYYNREDVRSCPICHSRKFELVTRKGSFFYVNCKDCKTIYIDKISNKERQPKELLSYKVFARTLQQVADAHNLNKNHHINFGKSDQLKEEMCKLGWSSNTMDEPLPIFSFHHDLVSVIYKLETIEDPIQFLEKVKVFLHPKSVLFVYGHDAALYPRNNSWLPLNTKVAGETLQILSKDKVCEILKSLGFDILQTSNISHMDYMITATTDKAEVQKNG